MDQSAYKKILVKSSLALLISVIVVGLFWWLKTHSRITVEGLNTSQSYTITLKNQQTKKIISLDSNKQGSISTTVGTGDYEVSITSGDDNFFEVTVAKSFLRSSTIKAQTTSESPRQFVGNNPGECMIMNSDVLISSPCIGKFYDLKVHIPAQKNQPTYTTNDNIPSAVLESLASTKKGALVLVNEQKSAGSNIQSIYKLKDKYGGNSNVEIKQPINLPGSYNFEIKPYLEGFLAYSKNTPTLYYFSDISASATKPKTLVPVLPDSNLRPTSVDIRGDKVMQAFTSDQSGDSETKNPKTEIFLTTVDKITSHLTTDKHYDQTTFCGSKNICMKSGSTVDIYDILDTNLDKPFFSINDVTNIIEPADEDGQILSTTKGLLLIDLKNKNGHYIYYSGDYKVIAASNLGDKKVVLSVEDNNKNKSALVVDSATKNSDNIDKKILQLYKKVPNLSLASVYKNQIYITPKLLTQSYNQNIQTYAADPTEKQAFAAEIYNQLSILGISTKDYIISGL